MSKAPKAKRLAAKLAVGTCEVLQWPITADDIRKYGWTDQQVSNLQFEEGIAVVLGASGAPPAWIHIGELGILDAALTAEMHVLRQKMADTYDEDAFYAIWQQLWKLDDVQRSITALDPEQRTRDARCRADGPRSSSPTADRSHMREGRIQRHLAAVANVR
jgi:hypothetical protein